MSANLSTIPTPRRASSCETEPLRDGAKTGSKLSTKRLRPEEIARAVWTIDHSGVLDLLAPPRRGPGRRGMARENLRLFLIGISLCARLGHETTIKNIHEVLTEAIDRDTQWELGVLRPRVTESLTSRPKGAVDTVLTPALVERGKLRKRVFAEGHEEISYDDLVNVTVRLRKSWDYGPGSAAEVDPAERERRARTIADVVDALLTATTIVSASGTWAIDATGQWAWFRGSIKDRAAIQEKTKGKTKEQIDDLIVEGALSDDGELVTAEIAQDEDGATAPASQEIRLPKRIRALLSDGAWGHKTGKDGNKELGFGFHMHTCMRTPDPGENPESVPMAVDAFALTPANADVVEVSLGLIDRIRTRHPHFRLLLGDLLYSNLKADRWAVPLAERGIEQALRLRTDQHGVVDIQGAQMQHHWLHCPAAPMHLRPLPEDNADSARWEEIHDAAADFQRHWAFTRKESGLGSSLTSKWVCPAVADRVGCYARPETVQKAIDLGQPLITPPADWRDRPCCSRKSIDFTPEPTNPNHQRKIAQREYVATKRWRRATSLRSLVEGGFGIMKNPSRQRLRRGQNRLPGLAMATIITGVKVALFNEEQLRIWHDRTESGPAEHPLLQPDQPDYGFRNLTKGEADEIDAQHLARLRNCEQEGSRYAAA